MKSIANNIKQRLSMREPLCDSLDVLAQLTDTLSLTKVPEGDAESNAFLANELAKVKELYPACSSFEREFPSLAFSIATGVGKTRLMGASIAYLYLKHKIRNFFILAPNLTIYNKLIRDFDDTGYSKYVFNGIAEFVHNRPIVITGENYNSKSSGGKMYADTEIRINIFNIAKFNSDTDSKKGTPRIKRLSEYLGQSYFDYLSSLNDLVILMDEAHRYHADASKTAINELKPILGLELTATPIDEKGNVFKNIVFEYNLAKAFDEGKYVKNPTIAKRKDFVKGDMSDEALDVLKLEDGVSVHEDAKIELELYARNYNRPLVKPFILVVAKDTTHANSLLEVIKSDTFFKGYYKDKVIIVHSNQKGEEKDENISQLVSLEDPQNTIEIVIHVNMLKEGWDVTNLYTIVPLRAANAQILTEQTIGRGLRLPFDGKRTGVDKVDKLTIIAHENFEALLKAAQDKDSIFKKVTFATIEGAENKKENTVITVPTLTEEKFEEERKVVSQIPDTKDRQKANSILDARKAIVNCIPKMNAAVEIHKFDDLSKPEVIQILVKEAEKELRSQPQGDLFVEEKVQQLSIVAESVINDYKRNIIEIPRIDIVPGIPTAHFEWFDLDVSSGFSLPALQEEIIRVGLHDNQVEILEAHFSGWSRNQTPVNDIIVQLMNYEEIDYDNNAELLHHLASQAFDAINTNLEDPSKIKQVIRQFIRVIADRIYAQMKDHFSITYAGFSEPIISPFSVIEKHNYTLEVGNIKDYTDIIHPISLVPKFLFRGYLKACHAQYKFDSGTELDLSYIFENDKSVLKWLRPAFNQFHISYNNKTTRYEPDFVVETADTIYLIEAKAQKDMDSPDVLAKKEAAEFYCKTATEYTSQFGGKPWKYIIIPHTDVNRTVSFGFLTAKCN